jgi:hypothetical protein
VYNNLGIIDSWTTVGELTGSDDTEWSFKEAALNLSNKFSASIRNPDGSYGGIRSYSYEYTLSSITIKLSASLIAGNIFFTGSLRTKYVDPFFNIVGKNIDLNSGPVMTEYNRRFPWTNEFKLIDTLTPDLTLTKYTAKDLEVPTNFSPSFVFRIVLTLYITGNT